MASALPGGNVAVIMALNVLLLIPSSIRNTSNFNVKGTYIDNISYGWGTVVSVTNEVTGKNAHWC
jgi:hypothetical protein